MEGLESDINLLKDPKYKVDSFVLFSAPWEGFNLTSENIFEQVLCPSKGITQFLGVMTAFTFTSSPELPHYLNTYKAPFLSLK